MNEMATNSIVIREAPDSWSIQPIQTLCLRVTSGGTPFRGNPAFYKEGTIPWFKTQELTGWYLDDSEEHITELALSSSSAKIFPANTVLMAMYGDGRTITSLGILRRPAASNQACCALIPDPKLCDYRYLIYALKYHRDDFLRLASGGAQRNLSGTLIRNFLIRVPPLWEQRTIGETLGALDDKVELNRRMNQTLEAMARAIFKSWFVDFEPFNAAPLGSSTIVPSAWKTCPIGDAVTVLGGSTPSTTEARYWGGDYNFATPKDLSNLADPILLDTERTITAEGLSKTNSGLLNPGTVLLSSRAPIGYLAITEIPVAVNQGFIAMACDRELPNYYVLQWARHNMETIIGNANGTTFLEISKQNFRPIEVMVPPKAVLDRFVGFVDPIYRRIVSNLKESRTLSTLRDTLLPKLLSGEIRVKQAKKAVTEVF